MVKKIESHNLIVKSNRLIEANYRLDKYEQKIMYRLMMSIDKDDKDFKPYVFSITEFTELLGIKDKKSYKKVKKYTKNLTEKGLEIFDVEQNSLIQVSWLSSARYEIGKGYVTLMFDPNLKPFLLQLKNNLTKIDGRIAIQLKSGFSIRINELLQQYLKIGERIFTIEELRKKLGILDSEYKLYGDFKRYVILQAQKEINNHTELDLWFDFEEIKTGRSVTSIRFIIKRKFVNTDTEEHKDSVSKEEIKQFVNKFNDTYGANLGDTPRTKKIVTDLMKLKGLEHFKECLKNFGKVMSAELKQGNIRRVEGFFMYYVKHGYNFNTNAMGEKGIGRNFEEREYTAEDFEKYYYKVPEED